jgi:hypothetical protein
LGYYRSHRRNRSRSWSSSSASKFSVLASQFGGAVGAIKKAFFELSSDDLNDLFEEYGELYGANAEKYARGTFSSWKHGTTSLSGQTMERLVSLVPPFLSAHTRMDLLKEVLKKNKSSGPQPKYQQVVINTQNPQEGFDRIDRALAGMRSDDVLVHLSAHVMDTAKWLYDDDITSLRAVLAAAEERENTIVRQSAERELALLRSTVESGQVKHASYLVKMPAGELSVSVWTPRPTLWQRLFG